jgi:hypothetical protein
MKLVHCIVGIEPFQSITLLGIEGPGLHLVRDGWIGALCGEAPQVQARPDWAADLLAHHRIVDAALARFSAVVPCRVGTRVPDEGTLLELIRNHSARLQVELERLRDKRELAIRCTLQQSGPRPAEAAGPDPDTADPFGPRPKPPTLDPAARELKECAERWATDLEQFTSPLWVEMHKEATATESSLLLSHSYLVPRKAVEAFRRAYQEFRLRQRLNGITSCSGPWAPYSFCRVDLTSAASG